ncbi:MAG: Permease [Parcubacteria group bacterium GW2011_GWC1_35_8]|uniref:Permease n=3 Tax=Candidatus Nomuraibacteriota TaxID=1752729 RepID=A0A0G0GC36_9BACT|nr:MAG: Permease [Parcubacteria group bacterium GW2011_GWC1_35_8]KKP89272.1 MAG: Permease [Candidatus Nomurabacteria bacterium GW2011_GWC2_35_8]
MLYNKIYMIILISIGAFVSTFLGGIFALRFKDKLHLILGFSAGAVIGVAFFDLLPEAIELGKINFDISFITSIVALGFVAYTILDRFVFFHSHNSEEHEEQNINKRGILGAGSLSLHSFLDGAAVGLAFQVSSAVGAIVAIAVLVHDFSDGINTVNMVLKNSGTQKQAFKWLLIDAIAPVLGITSTLFFSVPESALGIILALFAGFFLYIGASDLLPESHHSHPTAWTTFATILGVAVLYGAIRLAGI